jgi:gliding motility-associated-like protein
VYEKNTSYTVQLYVQNSFACSDTITQKTSTFNNNQFFIPNAFSPNGDQFNETIQIHGITNEACSFKIFNRWGELIYETQNNSPWDGYYQNQACMQGVYMYIAYIQSKHKGPIELRGSLTLLK